MVEEPGSPINRNVENDPSSEVVDKVFAFLLDACLSRVDVNAWKREVTRDFIDSLFSISYSIATGTMAFKTRENIFTQPMCVIASYSGPKVSFNTQNKHSPKMPSEYKR